MTDDEAKALGMRAVACRGWRWMRGMVDTRGVLVMAVGANTADVFDPRISGGGRQVVLSNGILSPPAGYLGPPDFRDAATRGCLLELVRNAWGEPSLTAVPDGTWSLPNRRLWGVQDDFATHIGRVPCRGRTEAEALVAALEAAP